MGHGLHRLVVAGLGYMGTEILLGAFPQDGSVGDEWECKAYFFGLIL
jgi:hypothetical protein